MSKNNIIESGILERYILGTTSSEENSLVQQKCKEFPELNQELEAIEMALVNYAETSSPLQKQSSDKIKEKVFSEINTNSTITSAKVIPLNSLYYRMGIAASALLLITSMVYNMFTRDELRVSKQELAKMQANEAEMNEAMLAQKNEATALNEKMLMLTDPSTKNITLNGMNSLADKKAMVHFNPSTKEVYFNARGLQLADASKQYQLWAIVDGKPIDMGMIDLNTKAIFQKMKALENAQAFAVTIEKKGGSFNPTMNTMCLLGDV
ncbi:MAG: anti-sigma factor [Bacteroidota bacterium]|nr:anti-sigma factor [Bacteroidota bacterium]